jgi:hypothetical protein
MNAKAVPARPRVSAAKVAGGTKSSPRRKRAAVGIGPQVPMSITSSFAGATSSAQGIKVVSDTLTASRPIADRAKETGALVHWASVSGTTEQRRTLVKAFKQTGASMLFIHHLSELPQEQTASLMKDYFAAGGDLKSVVEWLRVIGFSLRHPRGTRVSLRQAVRGPGTRRTRAVTRGLWDDFTDWVSDTAGSVVDAVGSVVDAVIDAGKSLAQAIGETASWALDQLTDLVEALVRAGKRVGDILASAAAKSVALLQKYTEAVLAAGRALSEVLIWAATQVATRANAVVSKLLQLGKKIIDILKTVVGSVLHTAAIVKAILAAGKKLADIAAALVNQSVVIVKGVVEAMLAAGQTLRAVLVEAAKLVATTARAIVQTLLQMGKTMAQLIGEAAAALGTTLRIILGTLLELGKTLVDVLTAIASLAASTVKAAIGALITLGKKVSDIVIAAVSRTLSVVRAVFTALIALGRKVKEILVALAGRAVSALRTALEALLAMGITLASIVADIVTGVVEAFRRGFFEGLVALGKAPLLILKAAAEVSASVCLLAFTVVIELFGGHRTLSPDELKEARNIFGSSINLGRVKIAVSSLPADIINYINGDRPFTTLYVINFGSNAVVEMHTLIHELTHVWQGVQTGPLYMVRALEAQIGAGVDSLFHTGKYDDSASYVVTNAALKANQGDFGKFNPEQQASIVEFFWMQQFGGTSNSGLPSVALLEPYARQAFKPLTSIPTKQRVTKTGKGAAAARRKPGPRNAVRLQPQPA